MSESLDCPKCLGKLDHTVITAHKVHKIDDLKGAGLSFNLEVDRCFVCGGVWFNLGELNRYLDEQMVSLNSPSVGHDLDQTLDQKPGKCPACKTVMKKTTTPQTGSITVDTCESCEGIWLDSTEIDRVEKLNARKNINFLGILFENFKLPKSPKRRK